MKKKKISDYENYLLDVHAKVITPDEIVNQVVKEATGFDVFLKKRIISGEVNEVYTIESSDRSQIVVRISRGEKPNFAQEKWVINECRKIDIPVPEILLIKYIDYGKERLLFCVQRKIEGDPLERGKIDYHNLDKENLKKIIIQAGEILSKIHSINIKGFGYLNKNGIGEFKTFSELMSEHINHQEEFFRIAKEINFDISVMERIFKILSNNLKQVSDLDPFLNHNDFGPKHIMVNKNQITGILDWGEVSGHSPINDFAKWDYWFGEELPIELLKQGYLDKKLFNEDFEWMLNWIKLNNGLGVLWWYYQQKYKKAVEKAKNKLIKELKYYK